MLARRWERGSGATVVRMYEICVTPYSVIPYCCGSVDYWITTATRVRHFTLWLIVDLDQLQRDTPIDEFDD